MEVRPIDANELKKHPDMPLGVIPLIDATLTLDYEPVVHAHWIDKDKDREDWHIHQHKCSNCGMGDQHNPNVNVPYCWFCGAKMDEEVK